MKSTLFIGAKSKGNSQTDPTITDSLEVPLTYYMYKFYVSVS